jgi:hypothetical protein
MKLLGFFLSLTLVAACAVPTCDPSELREIRK